MSITYSIINNEKEKEKICKKVLKTLPKWFGIPEEINKYCRETKKYFFIVAKDLNKDIGFISIKKNTKSACEIYVMGIIDDYHRKGIGTKLINKVLKEIKKDNIQYLVVKTVDESKKSKEYENTRLFYLNNRFVPIAVKEKIWGDKNPCLLMIRKI